MVVTQIDPEGEPHRHLNHHYSLTSSTKRANITRRALPLPEGACIESPSMLDTARLETLSDERNSEAKYLNLRSTKPCSVASRRPKRTRRPRKVACVEQKRSRSHTSIIIIQNIQMYIHMLQEVSSRSKAVRGCGASSPDTALSWKKPPR